MNIFRQITDQSDRFGGMIGTLFSILFATFFFFAPIERSAETLHPLLLGVLVTVPILLLFLQVWITVSAWSPIERMESTLVSKVARSFRTDTFLRWINLILLLYVLCSVAFLLNATFFTLFPPYYFLPVWILSTGVAFDLLHYHFKRIFFFLDPYAVLGHFKKLAVSEVTANHEKAALEWIETFGEIARKGIDQHRPSLTTTSLDPIRVVVQDYLILAKSVVYQEDEQISASDHVSFSLFRVLQNLGMLYVAAGSQGQEMICRELLTLIGKIIFYAARYDFSLAVQPIQFLGNLAKEQPSDTHFDLLNHAILTYVGVTQVLLHELECTYANLNEVFFPMIDQMHQLTNLRFKKDKSISVSLLKEPFLQLKQQFSSDALAKHQDTPSLLSRIDKSLEELSVLESVMTTIVPPPSPEKTAGT